MDLSAMQDGKASALVRSICELIPTLDGWCTPERAVEYARLILTRQMKTSVVLGVWGGRDVFACAMAHRLLGEGSCLGVDPWSASASLVGQTGAHADYWKDQPMHDLVYGRFIHGVETLGLAPWIRVARAKSSELGPPPAIDLLIVDANHGPDAICDVERWAPNVVKGGVVYCDDISWEGGAVREAVVRLEQLGFDKTSDWDSGAFFERMRVDV